MRARLFMAVLFAALIAMGIPSREEPPEETSDDVITRVLKDCKYMADVGTFGGAETLADFDDE